MNAVAARLRANLDNGVTDARRLSVEDLIFAEDPEREHVHQRIAVVAIFKDALAAHGRNAEAVAVMRDARHHAFHNPTIARHVQRAETQGIHDGDRPRTHGEDVAQNAAYARCGALERLDEARM